MQQIAFKNWFLVKNFKYEVAHKIVSKNIKFIVTKETDKAYLVKMSENDPSWKSLWVPKSAVIDEWEPLEMSEKDKSMAYHEYLCKVVQKNYAENKMWPQSTIISGPKHYRGDAFIHQKTTKELIKLLDKYSIEYKTKEEFLNEYDPLCNYHQAL